MENRGGRNRQSRQKGGRGGNLEEEFNREEFRTKSGSLDKRRVVPRMLQRRK